MRVAFLGLGRMGSLMAGQVLSAGHELTVWNRSPGKAGPLVERGAVEAGSVSDATREAEAVVLMLFGPDSVRAVLADVAAPAGTLLINGTTIGPQDARAFASAAAESGLRYLDAPVAGSLGPAADGTLGVLAGAAEADFADARPLLETWGAPEKVRRVGEVGAGSAMKLCVNQGLGVVAAGLGESLRLGHQLGLEQSTLLDVLGQTAYGWFLNQKRPMLDSDDFSATTFSVELMAKDLALAVLATPMDLPVTSACAKAARGAAEARPHQDYAVMAVHVPAKD